MFTGTRQIAAVSAATVLFLGGILSASAEKNPSEFEQQVCAILHLPGSLNLVDRVEFARRLVDLNLPPERMDAKFKAQMNAESEQKRTRQQWVADVVRRYRPILADIVTDLSDGFSAEVISQQIMVSTWKVGVHVQAAVIEASKGAPQIANEIHTELHRQPRNDAVLKHRGGDTLTSESFRLLQAAETAIDKHDYDSVLREVEAAKCVDKQAVSVQESVATRGPSVTTRRTDPMAEKWQSLSVSVAGVLDRQVARLRKDSLVSHRNLMRLRCATENPHFGEKILRPMIKLEDIRSVAMKKAPDVLRGRIRGRRRGN